MMKFLAARCPFFSGRVMLWRRFRRLCWESDLRGNRSSRTWCAQYRTFENNRSSASSTSSSAVITDYHRPDWAARRRNVSKRRRSAKKCQKDLNRTGGNHQDALVLCGRRLSSSTWNPTTLPEWSNWHGPESSTLETDVYIWRYALLVLHEKWVRQRVQWNGWGGRPRSRGCWSCYRGWREISTSRASPKKFLSRELSLIYFWYNNDY